MKRRNLVLSVTGAVAWLSGCSTIPGGSLSSNSDGGARTTASGSGEEGDGDSSVQNIETTTSENQQSSNNDREHQTGGMGSEVETVTLEKNKPIPVVKTFYEALYTPDVEAANNLLHPDSPEPLYSEEAVSRFEEVSHELEELEVVQRDEESAVVEFVLVLTEGGKDSETGMVVELRMNSGENWKIWEAR
jgi:hypothetical protein